MFDEINAVLDVTYFGVSLRRIFLACLIIAASILFKNTLTHVVFLGLRRLARRSKHDWDDRLIAALQRPISFFVLVLGGFFACNVLPLSPEVNKAILILFKALTTYIVVWGINKALGVAAELLQEHGKRKGLAIATFVPLFKQIVVVIIAIIGIIMIFETLGYSVSSIIAALGIGGAALAFASQSTIANLYGSISIALDRPFKVGDVVKIGATEGVVENIGLRSTQIRTLTKSLVSIPNNTVANEVIDNWSAYTARRIMTSIGVEYGTTQAQLEGIIYDIKMLMQSMTGQLVEDPQLVHFEGFGESSLNIQIVTFSASGDIKEFFKTREKFFFEIMKIVEKHGSSFAFPTRTLHIASQPPQPATAPKA